MPSSYKATLRRASFGWFGELMLVLPWIVGFFRLGGLLVAWIIRAIWDVDWHEAIGLWSGTAGFIIWLWMVFGEWRSERAYRIEQQKMRKRVSRFPGGKF